MTNEANGDQVLSTLHDAMVRLSQSDAEQAVTEALDAGIAPRRVLEDGLTAGMQEVGARWDAGQMFLPQVMVAARIFHRCSKLVEPALLARGDSASGPLVLLATVKGDVHDLGKSIVASMLRARGCEVQDLGKDVTADRVVEAVQELQPRILGLSAMLTSTMGEQQGVIEALERADLRPSVKVIVGGAPITAEWADRIGADGYGANAAAAVKLLQKLAS